MSKLLIIFILSFSLIACGEQLTAEEYINSGKQHLEKNELKSAIIEFKNAIKQAPKDAIARKYLGQTYLQTYSSSAAIIELKKARDLGLNNGELTLLLGKAYTRMQKDAEIIEEIKIQNGYTKSQNADIHAIRALSYFRLGQESSGIESLNEAKSLDDSTDKVRLAWAIYEKSRKNIEAQIIWLNPLLNKDKGVPDAWSQMAEIKANEGKLEESEALYTKAIDGRGLLHTDYAQRALIRVSLNKYIAAKNDLDLLKKAGLQWPIIGHIEGLIDFMQENYDQAQSKLSEINAKHKDYSPTQLILGLVHYKKGNFQSTIKLLEQYIRTFPDAYQPNIVLAAAQLKLGQAGKAITLLEKMQELYINDYRVLSLLGNAYIASNKFDLGSKVLNQAVKINPDEAETHLQLGAALIQGGIEISQGQREIIKAIELDPELHQAELFLYSSYLKNKKFNDARKVARDIETKRPETTLGANLGALTYMAEENKPKAIVMLNDILKKNPLDALTSINLARIYLQDKNVEKAKELYLGVLEKEPNNLKALNQLAIISKIKKDHETSIEWLMKAVERNPEELSPKVILANQYLLSDQGDRAVKLLNEVNVKHKTSPEYLLLMARAKMSINEFDHAIRLLKTLINESSGSSATAHFSLAQAYAKTNQQENVRSELIETLNINPDYLAAKISLARLDLIEKKYEAFKARITGLMKIYPNNPDVKFLFSKVKSEDGQYKDAIATLSSLENVSDNPEVVAELSRNQWLNGSKSEAISTLELWLEGNQPVSNVLMLLAQYQMSEGRHTEAKNTYAKLDELTPDNPIVLNNLAWILKDSDPNKAIEYAEKALSLDKDNAYIKDTLSGLYLIDNQPKKALEIAQEAALALPNYVEVQINYARTLAANNNKVKAREVLKKMLPKVKTYEDRKQINDVMSELY